MTFIAVTARNRAKLPPSLALPPSVADPVTPAERLAAEQDRAERRAVVQQLSPRQLDIALTYARAPHLSTRQVASARFLTENTIKTHLLQVFYKLQVNRRHKLVAWLPYLAEEEGRRRAEGKGLVR